MWVEAGTTIGIFTIAMVGRTPSSQHAQHDSRAALAGLAQVDMRRGAKPDDGIGVLDAAPGDIGVQIHRHDERVSRSDRLRARRR